MAEITLGAEQINKSDSVVRMRGARARLMSRSYTAWMDPPSEFSIGSTARPACPWLSASNAVSNCSHGSSSLPGTARSAAPSLYAPGAPW